MEKIKNKKTLIVLLIVGVLGIVGATIAFYTSSNTFNNVFGTKIYKMEVVETFESPDDWTPGTTTPKTLIATNKGDVDAAVRVSYVEEWKDASNNTLPLVDSNNERAAIINFTDGYENKWIKSTENSKDYYYYKVKLKKNEATTSLLESVTFNPNVQISTSNTCTTDDANHTETCTIETAGYAGGTYTLTITIETIQFDQYKNGWNTDVEIQDSLIAYDIVSGDLDTIGSIVKIADEEFYVIGQEDANHVKLLSKYNLKVGDIYEDGYTYPANILETFQEGDSGYGLQDPSMTGYVADDQPSVGAVVFNEPGDNYYWYDWDAEGCGVIAEYGGSNPGYIHTNKKENGEYFITIAKYVEDYVSYLNTKGVNVSGRLIKIEEIENLANNGNPLGEYYYGNIKNTGYSAGKEWLWSTTYWTGSVYEIDLLYVVSDGTVGSYDDTDWLYINGVRPVIILEK